MRRYTAVIALYPGPLDAPFCTVQVCRGRNATGEVVMRAVDTTVSTHDLDRDAAARSGDTILAGAGYRRTGEWEQVEYSLQAPVKRG